MKRTMYGTKYGVDTTCENTVDADITKLKELLSMIPESEKDKAIRLEKNALIVSESMRTEAIYWLKYTAAGFTAIIAYTVLFAYFG